MPFLAFSAFFCKVTAEWSYLISFMAAMAANTNMINITVKPSKTSQIRKKYIQRDFKNIRQLPLYYSSVADRYYCYG